MDSVLTFLCCCYIGALRESKKAWILDFAQRIPDPWAVFQIPKTKILESTSENSSIVDSTSKNFPVSEIRIPLRGAE